MRRSVLSYLALNLLPEHARANYGATPAAAGHPSNGSGHCCRNYRASCAWNTSLVSKYVTLSQLNVCLFIIQCEVYGLF